MKRLLVVGADKLGRQLLHELGEREDLHVVFDRSSSARRVLRLIRRGVISPALVARMAAAEWARPDYPAAAHEAVRSNGDLMNVLARVRPAAVYLFRAGLIINRAVLDTGIDILNVHCARVPDYGGLGSIHRALKDGAYQQAATLHRVTERIDRGEVLRVRSYTLDPDRSYQSNEDIAYRAGIELLTSVLRSPATP